MKARRFGFVTASFVPPGDRLNPYPLGTAATLAESWVLKVNSAMINADAEVEAVTDQQGDHVNPPPPAGAQYALVNVSMTYRGAGSGDLSNYVEGWLQAEGEHKAAYGASDCTPPPVDLVGSDLFQVLSGQTETGNLCFEIASKDASTLLLTGLGMTTTYPGQPVWFALRS